MKKYEVEVYRDVRESCLVTVEVDDEDQAEEEAMEVALMTPDSEWRRGHVVCMETLNCTKTGEE